MSAPGERYLALRVVMMPRDTNQYGTIFGGVILSYIDQAGHVGACRATGLTPRDDVGVLLTVAMDAVEFHEPVYVGDVVSLYTSIVRIGRTSVTVHVEVESERGRGPVRLTQADVTYVAVSEHDGERRPVPIRGAEE